MIVLIPTNFTVLQINSVIIGYPTPNRTYPFSVSYNPVFSQNELFLYLSGESLWQLGDCTFSLTPGSTVYIPQGHRYDRYLVEVQKPTSFVDIMFTTSVPFSNTPEEFSHLYPELKNRFLKIASVWSAKSPGYYARAMSLLYEIISHIQSKESSYVPSAQNNLLSPAIDYLTQNYTSPCFDYHKLASLSGLSYSYFKKQFIRFYGCPPVQQVTNLRIQLARELLATSTRTVSDIALLCGFENVYYFSNTFKKHTGFSPLQYRKANNR